VSRRKKAVRRPVPADPRYDSQTVSKFVNNFMERGKKSLSERLFYDAMDLIEQRSGQPGVNVFKQALSNLKPSLEVKSRRVGGATYQVPVEVRTERRQALAIRWIIQAARGRNDKTMVDRLSAELLDASNNRGNAVKKREDTHRMAEANRAFSHYRW
jgi:small subunit ribosomal protein S7